MNRNLIYSDPGGYATAFIAKREAWQSARVGRRRPQATPWPCADLISVAPCAPCSDDIFHMKTDTGKARPVAARITR